MKKKNANKMLKNVVSVKRDLILCPSMLVPRCVALHECVETTHNFATLANGLAFLVS